MTSNNFNWMGFLIAFQKGKPLVKKDRNKTAFLSAMIPGAGIAGVLTPLALAEKEVLKMEKSKLSVQASRLSRADEYIIDLSNAQANNADKATIVTNYIKKQIPQIKREAVQQLYVFTKIPVQDVKDLVKNEFDPV